MSTIILCGLLPSCQESDVHRALLMYGTVIDVQLIRQLQQGFVTMRAQTEAQMLVQRGTVNVMGVDARVVEGPNMRITVAAAAAATQAAPSSSSPSQAPASWSPNTLATMSTPSGEQQPPYYPPAAPSHVGSTASSSSGGATWGCTPAQDAGSSVFPTAPRAPRADCHGDDDGTNRLAVRVEDCRYPITRNVLLEMFNMVEKPLHVFCGPPNPVTIGDVVFLSAGAAARAIAQFNGKNIYPGCCLLHLSYAPLHDSRARATELTSPPPPPPPTHTHTSSHEGQPSNQTSQQQSSSRPQQQPQPQPSQHQQLSAHQPQPNCSQFSTLQQLPQPHRNHRHGQSSSTPPYPQAHPPIDRGRVLGGRGGGTTMTRGGMGRGSTGGFDPMRRPAAPLPYAPLRRPQDHSFPPKPPADTTDPQRARMVEVMCVPESVPLLDLFTLLEVFGNVGPIRRRREDRTTVIAQFQHVQDARAVVAFLDGCPLRGSVLRLRPFTGREERIPSSEWNTGPPTDPATLAFLPSPDFHHRSKPTAPYNPHGRVRPAKDLFVANLIEAITDDELRAEFEQAGTPVEYCHRKDASAAFVGFKNVATAVDALLAVHGKQLKERYLRINFSIFPAASTSATADSAAASSTTADGTQRARDRAKTPELPWTTSVEPARAGGAGEAESG